MVGWTFLTPHAPGVRLRDVAASLNISERSAFGIITDLVQAGYVVQEKDGRRSRYHIQAPPSAATTGRAGRHHRRDPGPADRHSYGPRGRTAAG